MKAVVLMSTYNGEKYIREQLDSILAQQGAFEVNICVRDDGSSDGTCRILQEYADAGKLQWYTGRNLRSARSFFDLVQHCRGYDYYAFADQDDYWHPDKLKEAIAALEDKKCPAIYCANARLVDSNGADLGRNVYNRVPHCDFYSVVCGGNIMGCTMVFNDSLARLIQENPVPEHMIMHDSIILSICTLHDGVIVFDEKPYMDYRQHGSNVVGAQWTKWDALKDRLERITKPQEISIAQQAESVLAAYPDSQNTEKRKFLQRVAAYRKSFGSAISLSCSRKPKFNGVNMAITMRLAILFRNR